MSGILARLVAPERPPIAGQVLVVVAHPDDETLGCGALMARIADLTIVHVTDGAPRDGADAGRHGFASPEAYASARRDELAAALAAGDAGHARLFALGIPDQGAASALAGTARRLVPWVASADLVLTHAYEGGHPDHDATAFAVHAAARLVADGGGAAPVIVEMPLYREGPDGGWLHGSFPEGGTEPQTLLLTEEERARKTAMLAAHASQAATLAGFGVQGETFRIAAAPDPALPPNGGRVLYDRHRWGMTSPRFRDLAREASISLGLGAPR